MLVLGLFVCHEVVQGNEVYRNTEKSACDTPVISLRMSILTGAIPI
jgi:hypothetical protein